MFIYLFCESSFSVSSVFCFIRTGCTTVKTYSHTEVPRLHYLISWLRTSPSDGLWIPSHQQPQTQRKYQPPRETIGSERSSSKSESQSWVFSDGTWRGGTSCCFLHQHSQTKQEPNFTFHLYRALLFETDVQWVIETLLRNLSAGTVKYRMIWKLLDAFQEWKTTNRKWFGMKRTVPPSLLLCCLLMFSDLRPPTAWREFCGWILSPEMKTRFIQSPGQTLSIPNR